MYATLDQPAEAERALAQVTRTTGMMADGMIADDYSNLGIVLMKLHEYDRALGALAIAVAMDPSSPVHLFNQANALSALGQLDQAEVAFRRCMALAPTLAGAHTGLGIVLAETNRLAAAVDEFRTAVRLQPGDPAALDNLKRAESMLEGRGL